MLEQQNPLVEGLEHLPVHPATLVIFGATGDLTMRKLGPALYNLAHEGALPERFNLIGVSRRDLGDEGFRDSLRESIERYSRRSPDARVLDALLARVRYVQSGFDDAGGYQRLGKALEEFDRRPACRSTASSTSRRRPASSR